MFLWGLFWIVAPNRMRREILRFSRIVESVLLIYRRKTRNLHLFSLLFGLYKELRSGKVRIFLLNSLLNYLNMSERALTRNDFGLKTEWWSTQIGEILASGVETRTFVELKLGDLSTVPCVIAKLEVARYFWTLDCKIQNFQRVFIFDYFETYQKILNKNAFVLLT